MLPVIVTPDVEKWAAWAGLDGKPKGYLTLAFQGRAEPYAQGVYVATAVPATRRDRMVIIRRNGGPRSDLLHTDARLGVDVWGPTEAEVGDLAALTEGLLLAARATGPVELVRSVSGPSPVPDSQPRRFLTVEVVLRGTVL